MSSGRALRGQVKKITGADVEVGNFITCDEWQGDAGTGLEASRALLAQIRGVDDRRGWAVTATAGPGSSYEASMAVSRDWGRKYLPTCGGSAYIDLCHLELCIPEVASAYDHVAASRAMLRVAADALAAANRELPPGRRIHALVNNSDGLGHSYGSHLNLLVTRRMWDDLFNRRLQDLLFLASYQVSSVVFTGQGKVGSENGRPPARFQLTQRGDFFECLCGSQTTHDRPIVNSRDESLCACWRSSRPAGDALARLHCIFFDSSLAGTAMLLKVGVMQIVAAMIEAGCVDTRLLLDDPLEALVRWGHDPDLRATARLCDGRTVTAVELQFAFLEAAKAFAARGGLSGYVPRASDLLELWEQTLTELSRRDFAALSRRLDWVLKRSIIERVLDQNPRLDWSDPEIKHLDLAYASLDPAAGLFWALERDGAVERVVTDQHVERLMSEPPADTRAWARAMLLRRAGAAVSSVDWNQMRFDVWGSDGWLRQRTLELPDPASFTRAQLGWLEHTDDDLDTVLDGIENLAPRPVSPDHS